MSIYQDCKDAGIEIDHHESDLYIPRTEQTLELLKKYPELHYQSFTSQIDGKQWLDVPFAYDPFWNKLGFDVR